MREYEQNQATGKQLVDNGEPLPVCCKGPGTRALSECECVKEGRSEEVKE